MSDGPAPLPCGCDVKFWKKTGEARDKKEGGEKIDEVWQAEPDKDPFDLIRREVRE